MKIDPSVKWTSLGDVSNLLIQKYYEWSASERLCQMIRSPGYTKAPLGCCLSTTLHRRSTEDGECQVNRLRVLLGKPINKDHYWPNDGYRYPSYFYEAAPMFIFYMHIVENVVITALGDIISGELKLVPYSCSQDLDPKPHQTIKRLSCMKKFLLWVSTGVNTSFIKCWRTSQESFPTWAS